jgi:hypothetical protein
MKGGQRNRQQQGHRCESLLLAAPSPHLISPLDPSSAPLSLTLQAHQDGPPTVPRLLARHKHPPRSHYSPVWALGELHRNALWLAAQESEVHAGGDRLRVHSLRWVQAARGEAVIGGRQEKAEGHEVERARCSPPREAPGPRRLPCRPLDCGRQMHTPMPLPGLQHEQGGPGPRRSSDVATSPPAVPTIGLSRSISIRATSETAWATARPALPSRGTAATSPLHRGNKGSGSRPTRGLAFLHKASPGWS